jgi:transcriptional regulator with XRE-family HTH domain
VSSTILTLAPDANQRDPERGARIAQARREAGLTQREAAATLDTSHTSLSAWENGAPISEAKLDALSALYGKSKAILRYGDASPAAVNEPVTYYQSAVPFIPNPSLRKRLRPAPYARVYEHIEEMIAADCSTEQIEEAERLMVDGAYNKLNARDPRDRTDEEMILDIEDAWDWIREVLTRSGVKALESSTKRRSP